MVFQSEKQRIGFFANIRNRLDKIKANREVKFRENIERQKLRIADLQQSEGKLIELRREQLKFDQQRAELRLVQAQDAAIRKKIFEASRAGRALALTKVGARKIGKAALKAASEPPRRRKKSKKRSSRVDTGGPFGS